MYIVDHVQSNSIKTSLYSAVRETVQAVAREKFKLEANLIYGVWKLAGTKGVLFIIYTNMSAIFVGYG